MTPLDYISLCENTYAHAPIVAGPDGRDGALVSVLSDDTVALSFRGTLVAKTVTSVLDWMNDFHDRLVMAHGFPGKVHAGFLSSLNNLWLPIIAELEHNGYQGALPWKKRLLITGHSKGGALAQLAGVRLAALNPTVVTFAAPRCGDTVFAKNYPQGVRVNRYEGKDDLVPWLPPFGYSTVGDGITQMQAPERIRRWHIDGLVAEVDIDRIVEAHHLVTYRQWIEQLKPEPEEHQAA